MLIERENVSQKKDEDYRRWFFDDYFDLIVWFADKSSPEITGFQLCYDKSHFERALTWIDGEGYTHTQIDEGEELLLKSKMAPVLVPDGIFRKNEISITFFEAAASIDTHIRDFVLQKIKEFT